ncbi:MAG: peptidylprolyl isomerase [Candidatus Aenigmarchaeota archaeon]|nr:peptidylprolyl isomerase [Candidatus Aenigmarchaeota archaeon]
MKKGDFIEVDFVGKVVATGEAFDLTSEKDAKELKVHNPHQKYRPALVVVGSGMVLKGVEKELEHMQVGEEKEFTVKPQDGFGQRRQELMRVISMSKFIKEKVEPRPGMFIDIDGMQAKVMSVSGGRVKVDYNHPLAGKELLYKVKILKLIENTEEKINSLLDHFNLKADFEVNGDKLIIKTERKMGPQAEKALERAILEWMGEIKAVEFAEKQAEKGKMAEEAAEIKE